MARVECPECGVTVKVADDLPAGRRVRCPKCAAVFRPFTDEERDAPEPHDRPEERELTERHERGHATAARSARRHEDDYEENAEKEDRPRRRPAQKSTSPWYWVGVGLAGAAATAAIVMLILRLQGGRGLDQDYTFDLEPNKVDIRTFAPVSKDETIKVSVTATGGKVRVFVYKEKGNIRADKVDVDKLRNPVAKRINVSEATLEAAIPAEHTAIVVVESGLANVSHVKLRVTN